LINIDPTDMILCADSGLLVALKAGLIPHAVIGDMDSLEAAGYDRKDLPADVLWIQSPARKDLTDTALCMEYALEQGCDELVILGGLGGRLDHTLANLQNMVGYSRKGLTVSLLDRDTRIFILSDGTQRLDALPGFSVSIFSWSDQSEGVTLTGMAYPLADATLTPDFPLGVCNEILEDAASIQVRKGTLLVVCSKK
jgi:thiamine pyrophosphokinase